MLKSMVLAVLLVLGASVACAEVQWKPKVIIHGGLGIPSAPSLFADGSSLGFGGGIGLQFHMAPPIMVQTSVDYTTFGLDEEGFRRAMGVSDTASIIGGEVSILYAAVSLKISLLQASAVRPYLLGGMGYFRQLQDDIQIDRALVEYNAQDATGIHGGVGVDVSAGPFIDLFAEMVYIVGFTEKDLTGYFPVRAGLAFELSPDI